MARIFVQLTHGRNLSRTAWLALVLTRLMLMIPLSKFRNFLCVNDLLCIPSVCYRIFIIS